MGDVHRACALRPRERAASTAAFLALCERRQRSADWAASRWAPFGAKVCV